MSFSLPQDLRGFSSTVADYETSMRDYLSALLLLLEELLLFSYTRNVIGS